MESADNCLIVSRNDARQAVGKALRLYVGRGRRYTVKQLSNGTGVPDRLIECAMCDPESTDYRPLNQECLLSISLFLGAKFSAEWLRLANQGAFDLPEEEMPPPGMVAADCAMDAAEVVSRAADGQFDADDKQALRIVGQRHVARGVAMVALAGRAA